MQVLLLFFSLTSTTSAWKVHKNREIIDNLLTLPVKFLNFLSIVKIFFPLFRHCYKVGPFLLQSLLKNKNINKSSLKTYPANATCKSLNDVAW